MPDPVNEPDFEESEQPEADQEELETEDEGTSDDDLDQDDADDDDLDDDEEDVDEDADLSDGVRQLRSELRAHGYTFDENGAPIAPEKSAAVAADMPAAVAEDKPALIPDAPTAAPFENPTEFQGFPVRADGMDLFDLAFENPESEEAQILIHGSEDDNGEPISEGIGEAGYITALHKYNRAKDAYAQDFETRVETAFKNETPAFQQRVVTARTTFEDNLSSLGEEQAKSVSGLIYAEANNAVADYIAERTAEMVQSGMTQKRATLIANKEVIDNPDSYELAISLAIAKNRKGFVDAILKAAKGEAVTTPAPAAKTPPRPPVPSVSRTTGGGAPPAKEASIVMTAAEKDMARMMGHTDSKAQKDYVRKLRTYTGVS